MTRKTSGMTGQKKCAPDSTHRPVRTTASEHHEAGVPAQAPACRGARLRGLGERPAAAVGQIGGERGELVAELRGVHGGQPLLALLQGEPALGHRGAQDLGDLLALGVGGPQPVRAGPGGRRASSSSSWACVTAPPESPLPAPGRVGPAAQHPRRSGRTRRLPAYARGRRRPVPAYAPGSTAGAPARRRGPARGAVGSAT